MLSERLLISGL